MLSSSSFSTVRPVALNATLQMPDAAQLSRSTRGPVQPVLPDAAADDGHRRLETLIRPLQSAAADTLLRAGANPHGASDRGALPHALQSGDSEMVGPLISGTANTDVRSPKGATPLMLAAQHGNASLVEMLLEDVDDIDAVAHHGYTALMIAAQAGHTAVVAKLVEAGAGIFASADDGACAVSLARLHGHAETRDMLVQAIAQSFRASAQGPAAASAGAKPGV